jgi:hypothetical protein
MVAYMVGGEHLETTATGWGYYTDRGQTVAASDWLFCIPRYDN